MTSEDSTPKPNQTTHLQSIEGWLFFYCLSRGVAEPCYFAYSFHKLSMSLLRISEIVFAVAGFGAVLLLGRRNPKALNLIAVDLLFRAAFSLFVLMNQLRHPPAQVTHILNPRTPALIIATIGLAGPVLWFLYFRTSRRVRAVLGNNLFD